MKRSWLNVAFWMLWVAFLGLLLRHPTESRLSLLLAAAAFWMNTYPRFLQGPRLRAIVNQITILRATDSDQRAIVTEVAISDFVDKMPSPAAMKVAEAVDFVRQAIQEGRSEELRRFFQQNDPRKYGYYPPDSILERFSENAKLTPAFFIPILVHNSGGAYASLSSLIMIADYLGTPRQQWAFAAYAEMDATTVMNISKAKSDVERLKGLFSGALIPPGQDVKLDLHFTPENAGRSPIPGEYSLQIFGYDATGDQILRTKPIRYAISKEMMMMAVKGGEWAFYVNIANNISAAVKRVGKGKQRI